jgi:sulfate adenylyltransferase
MVSGLQRLVCIYGTSNPSHPNVKDTMDRLGNIAVNGKYHVNYPLISTHLKNVKRLIAHQNAKEISGFMLTANPLNRAQERMIRHALDNSDMLILFLLKPFKGDGLRFDIRYEAIMSFIENFLPANRVVVVPLENTYIFSGYNELVLDALVAKNYGCTRLIVGKNHAGLGLYYDENRLNSIFDASEAIKLEVSTVDQYVYCDLCRTLVSNSICPHGQHHHIHYHSPSIMKLIRAGIMPPSVLVRREVSASILSTLFPDRFKNLQELYDSLVPNEGIMEKHSEEDFYIKLMGLYQTTSLT